MAVQAIPEQVLAKLPEMEQVFDALTTFSEGGEVRSSLPEVQSLLLVTDLPEAGSRWTLQRCRPDRQWLLSPWRHWSYNGVDLNYAYQSRLRSVLGVLSLE